MRMKWNLTAVIAVIAILTLSSVYSSIKTARLSTRIREARAQACLEQGRADCDLIARYHDACFRRSYRADYRVKTFHGDDYARCMDDHMPPRQGGL